MISWCESRPEEGGDQVVVGYRSGSVPGDLSPPGVSVRSRVHEYGGGSATLQDGVLYYVTSPTSSGTGSTAPADRLPVGKRWR